MKPTTRPTTLKDVSSAAGVSLFTVSRALSGHAGVAKATREHVRRVADRLGYVVNQHARNLKGTTSRVIGVLAASKANQYYATLVGGLEAAVEAEGFTCAVADAAMDGVYLAEREDRIIAWMIAQRVAAVVLTFAVSAKNLARLEAQAIPVLLVDCLPPRSHPRLPSVTTDNVRASRAMGDHLAGLGYRQWCFVGYAGSWNTREPRQQGFAEAALSCGASLAVVEGGNDAEVARSALAAFLRDAAPADRPRAIYAANTVLLKGVLLALADLGLKVPHDMAVVAFDEFDWSTILSPPLTVIDQHIGEIGRVAGQRLLELLDDDAAETEPRIVPPTLVVRQSCGAGLAPRDRPGGAPARPRLL